MWKTLCVSVWILGGLCLLKPGVASAAISIDLISDSTCEIGSDRLYNCVIPERTLLAAPMETAVPLRTVVQRQVSGSCSTTYPLAVNLDIGSGEVTKFAYASESNVKLRDIVGGVIASMQVLDASPWTSRAVFSLDCTITLEIEFNEPDVDTQAQALEIINELEAGVAAQTAEVDRLRMLLLTSSAYSLMREIAESFFIELSNDTMQELRQSALDTAPLLERLIISCEGMTDDERMALAGLYFALGSLGSPESWQDDEGNPLSFDEVLGSRSSEILAVVQELAELADDDIEETNRLAYEAAAEELARLEHQLELARLQLQEWLEGDVP